VNNYNKKLQAAAKRLRLTAPELDSLIESVLGVARLVRAFSRVRRSVPLDRKGTSESDTDHTVLLSLVACCIAAKYAPKLNVRKVAEYALVHDLVEAYSGDTNTMNYETLDREAKKRREDEAHRKLTEAHSAFPWLIDRLNGYEKQKRGDREANFVKTLDKAMPAVLHNLNDGVIFEKGRSAYQRPAQLQKAVRGRDAWLRGHRWASGQELALSIRELLMERVLRRHWEKYG